MKVVVLKDFLCALRLACNSHFFYLLGGAVVFLGFSAVLAALFSGRQPATIAMDVGFSVMRVVLPLVTVFLVQDLIYREFDRRYYLGSLSYPRARIVFLVGRFAAVLVLGFLLLMLMALSQFLAVKFVSGDYQQSSPVYFGWGYLLVLIFILLDFLVVASVALLLAVFATSPSFVLVGTFGFLFVARSYSSIIELVNKDSSLVWGEAGYNSGLSFLTHLFPDLGKLDIRMVALYDKLEFFPEEWAFLVASVFMYAFALWALTILLFKIRRFS